ncbi:glycosyltransferase family 4 protein [Hyphomonas pacifica]|uniref:Glycosyl transferase family 4 n=1 Tax=Hyphomonas pacifica TaxID=1280941 RepID=A0A062U8C3_9PROT|nr:hypothetical protein [Hyphomonas pacifica]KCZ52869.1 hypothetical protein HY2_06995 [Hyphomonas pacifica]RAN35333.1 hypothetical protein HY3_08525 [Hyphomonas pacifica]RAN38275.1 hypothetical protein HY11_00245 [Hyphomonas pacifica]
MNYPLVLFAGGSVVSFLLCGLVKYLPLLDAPDGGRKQQAAPVPRTGGLGILLTVCIIVAIGAAVHGLFREDGSSFWRVAGAVALVITPFLIGFADDWFGLRALTKLGLLLVWAIAAASPFFLSGTFMGGVTGILAIGWLIVITNATNFMDGSNGLAIGSSGLMVLGLFPLFAVSMMCWVACRPDHVGGLALLTQFAFFGAVVGFLFWNMQGVLYAGDCGSLGAGGLFGLMGLYLVSASMEGLRAALFSLTLCLPFLVDVLLTLAWRSLKRRNLLVAHTDHAYQRLRAKGWGHVKAALVWWGMTVVCMVAATFTLFFEMQVRGGGQAAYVPLLQAGVLAGLTGLGLGLWLWERSRPISKRG